MPNNRNIGNIYIYRIIHIDNIPHLLQFGVTHRSSPNSNPNFVAIGDRSLINNRSTREVIVDNDDLFNPDARTITLGDYIPFYFGVKMPMLYVIQNGGNFVERATSPEAIVYIKCPLEKIIESEINFYFSDGHATDSLTTFYDNSKIEDLPNIINWEAIETSYWGGHENLNMVV